MVDAVTNNRNLTQPQVGGDSGTWGGILNSGVMAQLDLVLGTTQPITMTSADVTLSIPQWNNAAINLTGALTGSHNLILPINANSATVAVGGLFVVQNNTTGAFNVTVKTAASGSVGVIIPQGARSFLFSDTTNVFFADDGRFQFIEFPGNPNGFVAGTQGSGQSPPSVVFDFTNTILYFCTTTGTSSTAVWTNIILSVVNATQPIPSLQGYLTPVSNTPIITSDSISAGAVYYTPYTGSWAAVHNGTQIIPAQFSQMQLSLTSSQAANNIYDVFLAYNSGTFVIGTGPSWLAGAGSITAGSCTRGTGAGSSAIVRQSPSGLWVNTNSISLIWNTGSGNTTITVAAGQGVYLGSIYIDATPGQVSCYRSYGQSRKWGIWNAYNRVTLILQSGDGTATWAYISGTIRPSNNNVANSNTVFCGLAEELISASFVQTIAAGANFSGAIGAANIGIGYNNISAFSGKTGSWLAVGSGSVGLSITNTVTLTAAYPAPPSLGINVVTPLEQTNSSDGATFNGTISGMLLLSQWRG